MLYVSSYLIYSISPSTQYNEKINKNKYSKKKKKRKKKKEEKTYHQNPDNHYLRITKKKKTENKIKIQSKPRFLKQTPSLSQKSSSSGILVVEYTYIYL